MAITGCRRSAGWLTGLDQTRLFAPEYTSIRLNRIDPMAEPVKMKITADKQLVSDGYPTN